VSAWLEEDQEEDSNATVPVSPQGKLERWMHIDHIYYRTVQLFDEAAADIYFSESTPDAESDGNAREPESEQSEPESFDDVILLHPFRVPVPPNSLLLGRKKLVWLRKLSEVLPAFLTHHRAFPDALSCRVLLFRILVFWLLGGGNVSRITEARHHGALLTYARVLLSSNSTVVAIEPPILELGLDRVLAKSVYPWFERTCLCLVALLMQCEFQLYYTVNIRLRLCVVAMISVEEIKRV
jgi:hypothetical protein